MHNQGLPVAERRGRHAVTRVSEMVMINWSEGLMVNNPDIDHDHKCLVEMINGLYLSLNRGEGKQVIGGILGDMADYVANHFYREERLMEQSRFPGLVEHIVDHWRFTQRLTDLIHAFEIGSENVALETLDFLSDWFIGHILDKDMAIGRYLAAAHSQQ